MNYGLYVSASGMMTNLYRQDVFANNLANVETDGFKPRVPVIKQRDPAVVEKKLNSTLSKQMLDKLGGGVLVGPSRINFAPGQIKHTGQPLDIALTGRKTFFAVQYANDKGQPTVGLTRDGRLQRNGQGQLVTPAGDPILDPNDQPIVVSGAAPVSINAAGQVMQGGSEVAQIQVSRVADTSGLKKVGNDVFAMTGSKDPRTAVAHPSVRVGYVEGSGVDPIRALMQLISATKAVSGNATMIKYQDQMMGDAINQLGQVS